MRDELSYEALQGAVAVNVPMLGVQGARDYQVTVAEDFEGWQRGLAAKANVGFLLYLRLDHRFVAGDGPSTPAEYATAGYAEASVVADIAARITAHRLP